MANFQQFLIGGCGMTTSTWYGDNPYTERECALCGAVKQVPAHLVRSKDLDEWMKANEQFNSIFSISFVSLLVVTLVVTVGLVVMVNVFNLSGSVVLGSILLTYGCVIVLWLLWGFKMTILHGTYRVAREKLYAKYGLNPEIVGPPGDDTMPEVMLVDPNVR
jgi:membrane glycosyltransferase